MNKTTISILAGLGGMFGWGISDFFAGQSSEKIGFLRTFFWSQFVGFLTMAAVLFILPAPLIFSPFLIGLVCVTGFSYAMGYLFFYKGFEVGNVSVVSAVINLQTFFIILVSYFLFHQTLTTFQIPAIVLLVVGILLVSVKLSDFKNHKVSLSAGVKETLIASIFFGFLTWPISEYIVERAPWQWTAFLVKCVALFVVFLFARYQKKPLAVPKSKSPLIKMLITLGALEALAAATTNFGVAYGDAILVAPISSSLTIVTVTLAFIFLKEKLTRYQLLGIALTILGILMTAF